MNKTYITLVLCLALLASGARSSAHNILVATFMIKNEAPVIQETLEPYVACGINQFFIFDTGSIDDTVSIVQKFFAQHPQVTAVITQEPFVDFATSRNRALELTHQQFPQAQFILMPDAEWLIEHGELLFPFCHQEVTHPKNCSAFLVALSLEEQDLYTPRLLRCNSGVRFEGTVHEAVAPITFEKVPLPIRFTMKSSNYGLQKTCGRLTRDVELLQNDYLKNPHNPRTLFYLAQTYQALGDLENAYIYYKKRTELQAYFEEDAVAWYRLGYITELLHRSMQKHSWQEAFSYYLKAFSVHPGRAEPLVRVAHYYVAHRDWPQAYFFAQQAAQIPYPINDALFIERDVYHYSRYDVLEKSARNMHDYATAQWALTMALKNNPNNVILKNRLVLYQFFTLKDAHGTPLFI